MAVRFKDYYQTLGVKRGATADEIKSAYRKLARKHHPDLNKNSKTAEARFKEIQEAYDVLADPQKRAQYDRLGPNYRDGAEFQMPQDWTFTFGSPGASRGAGRMKTGDEGGGFSEFFEMLFGGGPQSRAAGNRAGASARFRSSRGADVETVLAITLEEAFQGATKKVRFLASAPCTACQGSGVIAGSPCGACEGRGMAPHAKSVEMKVPPGIKDGARLRLAGQGDPGTGGSGPAGDMYVRVQVQPHPVFTLKGTSIHIDLPVAPWEAVLGAEVEVPTLGGSVKMKLPPGTQNGVKMRLKNRGMPSEGVRGDQIVTVRVLVPTEVTDRERHLFRQLRDISHFRPRVKTRLAH
jgi:curved DNA-binding protein